MSNCADLMDPREAASGVKNVCVNKPFGRSGSSKKSVCSHCFLAANLGKKNQAMKSSCDKNKGKILICMLSVNVIQMSCLRSDALLTILGYFTIPYVKSPSDYNVLEQKKVF